MFIDDDAPRLAGELNDWTVDHLKRLLNSIPVVAFESPQSLRWIEGIVRHVLGPDACCDDIRSATVARWLVGHIGDRAFAYTTRRSASRDLARRVAGSMARPVREAAEGVAGGNAGGQPTGGSRARC